MRLLFSLVAVALFAVATAHAQEPHVFGIGANLNPTGLIVIGGDEELFLPVGLTNILVSITPTPSFRIEPEIGLFTTSTTEKVTGDSSTFPGTMTSEASTSTIRLGVGLLYRMEPAASYSIYLGPRAGVLLASSTTTFTAGSPTSQVRESSATDIFVGLVTGGEYLIGSHFSLGAEVQLNYVSLGQPEFTRTPAPSTPSLQEELSRSMFSTNALVVARFYF